jgi:hypothetical protein
MHAPQRLKHIRKFFNKQEYPLVHLVRVAYYESNLSTANYSDCSFWCRDCLNLHPKVKDMAGCKSQMDIIPWCGKVSSLIVNWHSDSLTWTSLYPSLLARIWARISFIMSFISHCLKKHALKFKHCISFWETFSSAIFRTFGSKGCQSLYFPRKFLCRGEQPRHRVDHQHIQTLGKLSILSSQQQPTFKHIRPIFHILLQKQYLYRSLCWSDVPS